MLAALPAMAAWPERPITFVVPYGPGTNADIFARRFGERLAKALGQPVIIDNRPGANSTLGLDRVAKAAPDGYTFGHAATTNTVLAPMLQKTVPYDYRKDLAPITSLYEARTALMVTANSPFTTYAQLMAYARANPDKISYGYAQSTAEISGANWRKVTGLNFAGIPYKGTPQAVVDLMGGQIPVAFVELAIAVPLINTNKLRALAVVGPTRSTLLPHIPTFAEVQPNAATIVGFSGLMMPAGTPREIVERMSQTTREIVSQPEFVQFLASIGLDPMVLPTSAAFTEYLEKLEPSLRQQINDAGIKPQ